MLMENMIERLKETYFDNENEPNDIGLILKEIMINNSSAIIAVPDMGYGMYSQDIMLNIKDTKNIIRYVIESCNIKTNLCEESIFNTVIDSFANLIFENGSYVNDNDLYIKISPAINMSGYVSNKRQIIRFKNNLYTVIEYAMEYGIIARSIVNPKKSVRIKAEDLRLVEFIYKTPRLYYDELNVDTELSNDNFYKILLDRVRDTKVDKKSMITQREFESQHFIKFMKNSNFINTIIIPQVKDNYDIYCEFGIDIEDMDIDFSKYYLDRSFEKMVCDAFKELGFDCIYENGKYKLDVRELKHEMFR